MWGRKLPPDEAQTGLEFALALRFKHFTGGAPTPLDIDNCGWPKPDEPHHKGKPHYQLVAKLCKATFHGSPYRYDPTLKRDAKQIEQRLTKLRRKYPGLRYVGWPVRI